MGLKARNIPAPGSARAGSGSDVPDSCLCQAHEIDNLFVVDGGPFPTGTGANPTLTMMANAWRVSEYIATQWSNRARHRA